MSPDIRKRAIEDLKERIARDEQKILHLKNQIAELEIDVDQARATLREWGAQ